MLSTVCIADKNSLKSPSVCHNVESIDFAFCGLKTFKIAFKLMYFAFFVLIALCLNRAVKDASSALLSSGHVPKLGLFKAKTLCKYILKFNSHLKYVN